MHGSESQTYSTRRVPLYRAAILLLVLALAGCGDARLDRHLANDSRDAGSDQSNNGAGQNNGDSGNDSDTTPTEEEEELEDWYESQDMIVAPWTHEFDIDTAADAEIEADQISWPLPEYDEMLEYELGDILWAPVDDFNLAFARRILAIDVTDTRITFETEEAGFEDIFIKVDSEDADQGQPLLESGAENSQGSSEIRTRRQPLFGDTSFPVNEVLGEDGRIEDLIPLDQAISLTVCRDENNGPLTTSCGSVDFTEEIGDTDDPDDSDDSDDSNTSASSAFKISFTPEVEVWMEYVGFIFEMGLDIGDWGEDDYRCVCLAQNYDKGYDDIYATCSGIDASNIVDAKERCTGSMVTTDFKTNAGMEIRLKDFTVEVKGNVTWSVDLLNELLEKLETSIPCPQVVAGPVVFELCPEIPLSVGFQGGGGIAWTEEDSPSLTLPADVGLQYPAEGPGAETIYTPDTEYTTDDPGMNIGMPTLTGAVGGEVSLEILAVVKSKIAGIAGPLFKIGPYGTVYAELSGEYDTGTGEASMSCVLGAQFGGKLDVGVEASVPFLPIDGLSAGMTLVDTCDDLPAACYDWSEDYCGEGTQQDVGKYVRIVPKDDDGGLNDPDGLEIDAIHAIGDQLNQVHSVVESDVDREKILEADFEQCSPNDWPDKVGLLDLNEELVVELSEPMQTGDRLQIIRQDFPPNEGADDGEGGVIQCQPSGAYDVYVGKRNSGGGFDWGAKVASDVYNTTDWTLNDNHIP